MSDQNVRCDFFYIYFPSSSNLQLKIITRPVARPKTRHERWRPQFWKYNSTLKCWNRTLRSTKLGKGRWMEAPPLGWHFTCIETSAEYWACSLQERKNSSVVSVVRTLEKWQCDTWSVVNRLRRVAVKFSITSMFTNQHWHRIALTRDTDTSNSDAATIS